MIHDISLRAGWRDNIEMEIDEDIQLSAVISRGNFLDALDNIADDISEWISERVVSWLEGYFDVHEELDLGKLKEIRHMIEEARP